MPATQRARVLVSTDIGGTDPDDFQSMVHLLLYADVLDIEGLIASPYGKGRAADIHRVIDCYDGDLTQLRRHADFPDPAVLRAVVKQGSLHLADHHGLTGPTEGSEWIVHRARDGDARLLEVLVWGGRRLRRRGQITSGASRAGARGGHRPLPRRLRCRRDRGRRPCAR